MSFHSATQGDQFVFRHALLREVLYEELLNGERTRLHAAFARALTSGSDPNRGVQPAELAYHWHAAHDLPRALDAFVRAGLAAEGMSAFCAGSPRVNFESARSALWAEEVPNPQSCKATSDRVDLLAHIAHATEGSAPTRSLAYIKEAIALVDPATEPTRAGTLLARLGRFTWLLLDDLGAVAASRDAVALVPSSPPSRARALVLALYGRRLAIADRHARGRCALPCRANHGACSPIGSARNSRATPLVTLGADISALGDISTGLGASFMKGNRHPAWRRRRSQRARPQGDIRLVEGRSTREAWR